MSLQSPHLKEFTRDEVAEHCRIDDLWIIIDAKVYDLTKLKAFHPGGLSVLLDEDVAGCDATEAFYSLHRHEVLEKTQTKKLQIGTIRGETSKLHGRISGALSLVPYAEPNWLAPEYHSAYYSENHRQFQKAVRRFIDDVLYDEAQVREESGERPSQAVFDKMAEANMHAMRLGPGKHLAGRKLLNGIVKPEEFDYFHELILMQEFSRISTRGYGDGVVAGMLIGAPPLINFGSAELKARILPDILDGKKFICLAITEAHAGSDVMGLKTTAVKSDDGEHWIINGTKKWITNGTFADYFVVGCKTEDGFTVILVERGDGLNTRPIKTTYSASAGTAYITFEDVQVPVGNTLGEEGGGIFVMLSNFNHERFIMCCSSARTQRLVVEECLKWVTQREAFGKPLHAQAVIRSKLAAMISRAESCQHWLENITYQMCNMSYKQQSRQLALLKSHSTRCAQDTARDAVQVFGGRGVTKTGMGKFIEHDSSGLPSLPPLPLPFHLYKRSSLCLVL
ncbi:hypothetical protein D9611_001563 [Ephemerocybe angulata]|uniref:Cytochrome b5 heme-binding domain-containing protein n=1 Tax=Ephemerocybe angulata TaxID=980116 RepID=A0A8H5CKG5_9AGAR|nr:hypothetical protein D9611_001563 [Tulosesus angulatus]